MYVSCGRIECLLAERDVRSRANLAQGRHMGLERELQATESYIRASAACTIWNLYDAILLYYSAVVATADLMRNLGELFSHRGTENRRRKFILWKSVYRRTNHRYWHGLAICSFWQYDYDRYSHRIIGYRRRRCLSCCDRSSIDTHYRSNTSCRCYGVRRKSTNMAFCLSNYRQTRMRY